MENKGFAEYVGKLVDVSTRRGLVYIGKVTVFDSNYIKLDPYLEWSAVLAEYVGMNFMTLGIGRKRRREQLRKRLESLESDKSGQSAADGILIPREEIEYIAPGRTEF